MTVKNYQIFLVGFPTRRQIHKKFPVIFPPDQFFPSAPSGFCGTKKPIVPLIGKSQCYFLGLLRVNSDSQSDLLHNQRKCIKTSLRRQILILRFSVSLSDIYCILLLPEHYLNVLFISHKNRTGETIYRSIITIYLFLMGGNQTKIPLLQKKIYVLKLYDEKPLLAIIQHKASAFDKFCPNKSGFSSRI